MQNIFLKHLLLIIGAVGIVIACIAPLVATVQYAPFGVAEAQRAAYERKVEQIRLRAEAAQNPEQLRPTVVVPESIHDFGMMDPLTMGSHGFEIRNEGTESLILTGGETTCKCTLVKDATQIVDPGQTAFVTLQWNSGRVRESYEQTAIIDTNDPLTPEIHLKVRGRVRAEIGFSESEINFRSLSPDSTGAFDLDVYSQLYHEFDPSSIESTVEQLTWTVEPLDSLALEKYEARSGYRLHLSLATGELEDYVSGILRLKISRDGTLFIPSEQTPDAIPTDADAQPVAEPELGDPESFTGDLVREISIRGKIAGRIAFFGNGLTVGKGLDLGILQSGKEHTHKLFLRVRSDDAPGLLAIETITPEFLSATLEPATSKGVYSLEITIPADAPTHVFNNEGSIGRLTIKTNLVPSGEVILPISGAVVSK